MSCGQPNRYRYYLAPAYSDIGFWSWSEDDYYGHYLLEKRNWRALGCLTLVLLYLGGMGLFVFVLCLWWSCGVWLFGCLVWFFVAVWVLFLSVCFPNCLTPAFFTQKLWSFSCLSGRALDLRVDLCLFALSIVTSLNHGLPVSQRSAAACEEKKRRCSPVLSLSDFPPLPFLFILEGRRPPVISLCYHVHLLMPNKKLRGQGASESGH